MGTAVQLRILVSGISRYRRFLKQISKATQDGSNYTKVTTFLVECLPTTKIMLKVFKQSNLGFATNTRGVVSRTGRLLVCQAVGLGIIMRCVRVGSSLMGLPLNKIMNHPVSLA